MEGINQFHGNNTAQSPSPPSSPLSKRPCQLRRLSDFNTAEELELLKSVASEVVELKEYAEWFNSLGAEAVKDDILWPEYYRDWLSTLGTGAKVDGVLDFSQYFEWYVSKFYKLPEMANWPAKECAELALAYLKKKNECEDYEYVRNVALEPCPESFHLNFYARRKVSKSSLEPAPEKLFFAEVDTDNNVLECSVLEAEEFDLNGDEVLHPPNIDCAFCNGCIYYHCCPEYGE